LATLGVGGGSSGSVWAAVGSVHSSKRKKANTRAQKKMAQSSFCNGKRARYCAMYAFFVASAHRKRKLIHTWGGCLFMHSSTLNAVC